MKKQKTQTSKVDAKMLSRIDDLEGRRLAKKVLSDGLTINAAAKSMDIPLGVAKSLLTRAKADMKNNTVSQSSKKGWETRRFNELVKKKKKR